MSNLFRLGETAGLEVEFCNASPYTLDKEVGKFFQFTRDASIETNSVPNYLGIPINAPSKLSSAFGKGTMGKEIISRIPLEVDSSFDIISLLTSWLKEQGINSKSNRAGIHIHITCSPNFSILRESFNYGLYLEAPLFYFGAMGYEFRGTHNNCSYSFPLSRPPIIRYREANVSLYNEDDVFNSTSYNEITTRLGDLARFNTRYAPARYAYLNYFSTLLRGSLEFRIFNLTLSPFAIDLALRLSSHITKCILKNSYNDTFKRLESNPITSTSKKNSIKIMENFLIETGFRDVDKVLLIMDSSPDIFINPNPVFSHLLFHPSRGNICPDLFYGVNYQPKRIDGDIIKPVTTQSHNLIFENKPFPLTHLIKEPVGDYGIPSSKPNQRRGDHGTIHNHGTIRNFPSVFNSNSTLPQLSESEEDDISTAYIREVTSYSGIDRFTFIENNLDEFQRLTSSDLSADWYYENLPDIGYSTIARAIIENE